MRQSGLRNQHRRLQNKEYRISTGHHSANVVRFDTHTWFDISHLSNKRLTQSCHWLPPDMIHHRLHSVSMNTPMLCAYPIHIGTSLVPCHHPTTVCKELSVAITSRSGDIGKTLLSCKWFSHDLKLHYSTTNNYQTSTGYCTRKRNTPL